MRDWKAIVLGMDDTLFGTETISMKTWKGVGGILQLPTSDELILSLIGRMRKDQQVVFDSYMPKDWPQEEACSLYTQFKKEEKLKDGVPLAGDIRGPLDIVKAEGYVIAMVTNASAEGMEFDLNNVDTQHYSEAIVSDEMIAHGKPAPDVYLKTAQQLNLSPQECLVAEDSLNGVRATFDVGTIVVMIPDKAQPTKETKAMCNYILKSLDDLKEIVQT